MLLSGAIKVFNPFNLRNLRIKILFLMGWKRK